MASIRLPEHNLIIHVIQSKEKVTLMATMADGNDIRDAKLGKASMDLMESVVKKYAPSLKADFSATVNGCMQNYEADYKASAERMADHIEHGLTRDMGGEKVYNKHTEFVERKVNPKVVKLLREFADAVKDGRVPDNEKSEQYEQWAIRLENAVNSQHHR